MILNSCFCFALIQKATQALVIQTSDDFFPTQNLSKEKVDKRGGSQKKSVFY